MRSVVPLFLNKRRCDDDVTNCSAVLTTGQTGHWPRPPSSRGPELQGSGNFLLLNLAVKTLIGFLPIIWLYSTSLPFKIIFWLSTIQMAIISSIIVLAFSFQKYLLTLWFLMSNFGHSSVRGAEMAGVMSNSLALETCIVPYALIAL